MRFEADPAQNYDVAKPGSATVVLGRNSTLATIGNPNRNDGPASCESNGTIIDDCVPSDGTGHTADSIEFDPTGRWLFVSNGDNSLPSGVDVRALRSQNINSLSGKLMKIDPNTGAGAPDNPFYQASNPNLNRSKVYSYGLRNPFRFAFHPQTSEPFIGDVGAKSWEEINTGRGKNFGWPCYEGGSRLNLRQSGYENNSLTSAACQSLYNQGSSAVQSPLYGYTQQVSGSNPGAAVIVGDFYRGTSYPTQYRGALFIADYNRNTIQYLTFSSNGTASVNNFAQDLGATSQIVTGPDSNLWYVLPSGQVRRFVYTAGGNTPPTAQIAATPSSGAAPLRVQFSSAGTSDPENNALTYAWVFGDGGTSSSANPSYIYQQAGNYLAVLTVRDTAGNSATANIPITVGNSAPTAQIITPTSSTTYNANQVLSFSGAGSDPEDGTIPATRMAWDLRLHHNDHIHFNEYQATGTGGSFITPDHGDDTYLELCLTVTDSGGLQGTSCVTMQPNRVRYTYQTETQGLNIVYEGVSVATPYTANSIVNAQQVVVAPLTQGPYQFTRWSDGVTSSTRTITMGTTPQTFTAQYVASGPTPTATATASPPPSTQGQCSPGLAQEAEAGMLSGGFVAGSDSAAGGGQFVHVPNGTGDLSSITSNSPRADYCFTVATPGSYRIRTSVLAPSDVDNSFFVQVDGAPAIGYLWSMPALSTYQTRSVTDRNNQSQTVNVTLGAGQHSVTFFLREDGTRLDRVELELISASATRSTARTDALTLAQMAPDGLDYRVSNTSSVPITNVTLSDSACSTVSFIGGDTNNDEWLGAEEVWSFACTAPLATGSTREVSISGVDADGDPQSVSTLIAGEPTRIFVPIVVQ